MRSIRLPLAGLIYIAITFFVCIAAWNSQSNLLYWSAGLMIGAFLVALVLSRLTLLRLQVQRTIDSAITAGEPAPVLYKLLNPKRRPVFAVRLRELTPGEHTGGTRCFRPRTAIFPIGTSPPALEPTSPSESSPDAYCLYLPPRSETTLTTHLIAPRRGRLHLSRVELVCSFPFGFVSQSAFRRLPRDIIVLPRTRPLSARLAMRYRETIAGGSMTSSIRGGQDEFYGLRTYRPGDSVRAIHWKRSAKTGQLVVREMTSNAPPQMMVVLNLRGVSPRDDAAESAIELAASLISYGTAENFAVGLCIPGAPGEAPPTTRVGRDLRARYLEELALLDVASISLRGTPGEPSYLARRAHWIVVTLSSADDLSDVIPLGVNSTVMPLDAPDANDWLRP